MYFFQILHLDSPYARPQQPSRWTNGRNFLLTCRSNTIINTLGKKQSEKKVFNDLLKFSKIEDCVEHALNNDKEIGKYKT